MEFNKKSFWSSITILLVVFFGSWLLGIFFKPIIIATILAIIIVIWKSNTIWTGIKYYWGLLMNSIFKKQN